MSSMTIIPDLNLVWTRWSEYTIEEHQGVEYLVPAPDAVELVTNCAEHIEMLIADALELGRQIALGTSDKDHRCAAFAARHGLLGLDADEGLASSEDPRVPPCYRPLNSKGYGEELCRFQTSFMMLYQHFQTTRGEVMPTPNPKVMDLAGILNYRLTSGRTPQLIWEVRSMEAILHFAYAAAIAKQPPPLKICKNCGKVYCNPHFKSEFCGAKCRNHYNVKLYRQREKKGDA